MIHSEREYHQGKSRLVFAGQESLNGYYQIAVKFEKNKNTQTLVSRNPKVLEIRLPDRTVYVSGKSSKRSTVLDRDVDLIVSTKRDLNQHKEMGTDMLLFNPIHAPLAMDTRSYLREGIDVLVDSGGFQLAQGTSDFVSPLETAQFYTKHASIGMGLDFPSPGFIDKALYVENCRLQALNNDYIRRNIPDTVSMAPVVHGVSPFTRKHCLDTVFKKGRDKAMALAGLISKRTDSPEAFKQRFACMAMVLNETRQDVIYYHALGATSPWMLALYALLTKSNYVVSIGGDSVSHRQNAIGGSYKILPYFNGPVTLTQPVTTNTPARLPCSCPACVAVGDARILRDFRISELHHLYMASHQKVSIDNCIDAYIKGRVSRGEMWKFVMGDSNQGFRTLPNMVFDYFEAVLSKGYDNVPKLAPFKGYSARGSLFGSAASTSKQKSIFDRYHAIHAVYEKFHGVSLKTGKKLA